MIRVERKVSPIDFAGTEKGMATPFAGATIVVTGKLKYFTRSMIHAKIESLGAKAGRTVSRKTDYLIRGEKPGSKLDRAHLLGITVLTEEEFLAMAHQYH